MLRNLNPHPVWLRSCLGVVRTAKQKRNLQKHGKASRSSSGARGHGSAGDGEAVDAGAKRSAADGSKGSWNPEGQVLQNGFHGGTVKFEESDAHQDHGLVGNPPEEQNDQGSDVAGDPGEVSGHPAGEGMSIETIIHDYPKQLDWIHSEISSESHPEMRKIRI